MSNSLKNILNKLPKSAGVYQFFDASGKIIYIGKSVNIFSRVNSYFNGKSKLNFAKKKMVNQIKDIKTIVTENETESLMLESNMIKAYKPKYNILLKDDKNHLYIKITDGEYPKIIRTRVKTKGGTYFGPYISSSNVDKLLKVIKKFFGYGVGNHNFFMNKGGYNLDKYLFKGNHIDKKNIKEEYLNQIKNIKLFLKGDYKQVLKILEIEMIQNAKNLEFERANILKENIEAIRTLDDYQIVKEKIIGDYDVINYLDKYGKKYIGLIQIRENKIVGYYNYEVENKLDESIEEILTTFIKLSLLTPDSSNDDEIILTGNKSEKIPIIISPINIKLEESIYKNVKIEVPQIGIKADLLKLVYKNIYEYANKKHLDSLSTKGFSKKTMQSLLDKLGYKQINKDIIFECNDISHISGNHTVASRSVIENGKSNTSKYKKFIIKTLEAGKIDDFGSMKEIMTRRLKEIEKTGFIPDLIIIDGGKGQLSTAIAVVNNEKGKVKSNILLNQLQLVSIAKREEELFLPGKNEPILLDKNSNELRLVQKIRDEAHRFAITFNRNKRIKSMKKNILESLPGFGPKTRQKILKKFGSIQDINREELASILSKTQIETLENHGII